MPIPNDQLLRSIPESQTCKTPSEAIENSSPAIIPPGDTLSSKLEKSDPVIVLGSKNKYRSNYKVFQFEARENEIYLIELFSYPDNQNVLFPLLAITDKNGNVLDCNKIAFYGTLSETSQNASCIYCLQEVYTEEAGVYYILVMSDNSTGKGTGVTTPFREPAFTFRLKGNPGVRSPWGNFRICIHSKQ
jgi:hypothetical protein